MFALMGLRGINLVRSDYRSYKVNLSQDTSSFLLIYYTSIFGVEVVKVSLDLTGKILILIKEEYDVYSM